MIPEEAGAGSRSPVQPARPCYVTLQLVSRGRFIFLATLALALVILAVIASQVDLSAAAAQLRRVGFTGAGVMLLDMAIAMGGPLLGWHLLMRADGIDVRLSATMTAGLMGRAVNLVSPLMYFGGEGVRTFRIASLTGAPRSRILATVAASEFQMLIAMTASMALALAGILAGRRAGALPLGWMLTGFAGLALLVGVIFLLVLLDVRIAARLLGVLIRRGFFVTALTSAQQAVDAFEQAVHGLMVRQTGRFIIAQVVTCIAPVAELLQPAIFVWALHDPATPMPTLLQLGSLFVLIQLLFMLPTTPAGLGVYEGGIIGILSLQGWPVADAAAYAVLIRLDDVCFSLVGALLLARSGFSRALKGSPDA